MRLVPYWLFRIGHGDYLLYEPLVARLTLYGTVIFHVRPAFRFAGERGTASRASVLLAVLQRALFGCHVS